jgi:hypothetical protein
MLDEATYLKPTVMFGSKTIQVQNPHFLSTVNNISHSKMSYSRRSKAEGRRERLTNTTIAASGARDVEITDVMANETGEGVHPSSTSESSYA